MAKTAPRSFALQDLATLVNDPDRGFDVLLHNTAQWIDWEEASILLHGDVKVVEVKPGAQWPLQISFSGNRCDVQGAPYEEKMEFYCQTKNTTSSKKPARAL